MWLYGYDSLMLLTLKSNIQQPKNNETQFQSTWDFLKDIYRCPICNLMRHCPCYLFSVFSELRALHILNTPGILSGKTFNFIYFLEFINFAAYLPLSLKLIICSLTWYSSLKPSFLPPILSHFSQFLILCNTLNRNGDSSVTWSLSTTSHKKSQVASSPSPHPHPEVSKATLCEKHDNLTS